VHGEYDGRPRLADRAADRVDVVAQRDRRAVGVGRLEARKRQCLDVVALGAEARDDLVPSPLAEPEPWDQDDRSRLDGSILDRLRRLLERIEAGWARSGGS